MSSLIKNINHKDNNFFSNLLLIFIFLLFISLPILKTIVTERKEVSEIEKRKLAIMPVFRFKKQSLKSYPARFEAYINDHFGFRDDLIFFRNFTMFNLLKKSPVSYIVIGKNNWLYYKEDIFGTSLSNDFRGITTLSPLQLEAMRIHLETKGNWLEAKGIKFFYIAVPNKKSIYPEYLPENLNKIKNNTQLDQLFAYLGHNSDINILDLRPSLLEAKKSGHVYYRTDSHWNDRGAYAAYIAILKNLKKLFPDLTAISRSEIQVEINNCFGKDLSTNMGLPRISEKNVSFKLITANAIKNNNTEWALPNWPSWMPAWMQPFETSNEKSTIRAIVFKDSFMDAMLPFFSEHFKKAAYITSEFDYSILPNLIDKINPDIVIEECVERNMFLFFSPQHINRTMGADLLIAGRAEEAVEEFQKALSKDPNLPDNYYNLGLALLKAQKLKKAIAMFKKTTEKDPNHRKAHINLQSTQKRLQEINSRIADFQKELRHDPSNPEMHYKLASLYQKKNEAGKAAIHFQKAISLQPNNANAINALAVIYANEKKYDTAISLLKKVAVIEKSNADACYNIACLYSLQNNKSESLEWLGTAIQKGYRNWNLIKNDKDLENIRQTASYRQLIKTQYNH